MDKMRGEFEAYCKKRWPKHSLTFKYDLSYVDDSIEDAWLVWQASRQALVVELPPQWDDVCDKVMDSTMVKQSLSDAGIKWTE